MPAKREEVRGRLCQLVFCGLSLGDWGKEDILCVKLGDRHPDLNTVKRVVEMILGGDRDVLVGTRAGHQPSILPLILFHTPKLCKDVRTLVETCRAIARQPDTPAREAAVEQAEKDIYAAYVAGKITWEQDNKLWHLLHTLPDQAV